MTAAYTSSPGLADVYSALGAFILSALNLEAGQVVQGFPNRVAMPLDATGPFVVMYAMLNTRLRTNVDTWATEADADPTEASTEIGMQVSIQLDVYGATSGDLALILTGLLRDEIGCDALAPNCQPLYSDDPRRAPLVNAEEQYEDKWIVTAQLQYNPVISSTIQTAGEVGPINLYSVDATFPPG